MLKKNADRLHHEARYSKAHTLVFLSMIATMPNATSATAAYLPRAEQRWLMEQLMDAIRTERRLLDDLGSLMRQQRAAIAAGDHEALDDATFGIQRVVQTLSEASRRPRLIKAQLGGGEEVSLGELAESLGLAATPELVEARNELREAARVLEDELRTNRELLGQALTATP